MKMMIFQNIFSVVKKQETGVAKEQESTSWKETRN